MRRRPSELFTGDWVDVFCSVCCRRILEGEWRDENEWGTVCRECATRMLQTEDAPITYRSRTPRVHRPLHT